MFTRRAAGAVLSLAVVLGGSERLHGADWPMWRYDARRSSAAPESLAAELHLQWSRELPPLKPAWPDQPKMQFDSAYEPIVAGKLVFVGSSLAGSMTAFDSETGAEKWRFYADGPVRFAPLAWEGKLYFVADDGYLYCLDSYSGALLWKFRGAPADRRLLGNERLISTWPARGAPVIADGTIYFAASIWPFMGIFIHALDARSGAVRWTNDGDGAIYMKQPHGADAFASVAPQGPLVVTGDMLLIPGGRSVPACYDRKTGKMLRYQLAENGKRGGGFEVIASSKIFFNGGAAFELASEKWLGDFGKHVVLTEDYAYIADKGICRVYGLKNAGVKAAAGVDKKGLPVKTTKWVMPELAGCKLPPIECLIKAGKRLYAGGVKQVVVIDLPEDSERSPTIGGEILVAGTVVRLVAADGKLFAVTREGRLACFGPGKNQVQRYPLPSAPAPANDGWTLRARAILDATKVHDGYCIAWGLGSGRLIAELVQQSNLYIMVVEPDAPLVKAARDRFVAGGLYGRRVEIHQGDPMTFSLPPYLAGLQVSEDLAAAGVRVGPEFARKAFGVLRPYGGIACLPLALAKTNELAAALASADRGSARVAAAAGQALLIRQDPLPGAANWTHEHADAANTRVSKDQLVKLPLGVLWFGGPANDAILPRHGHGPQPQVIDGRLIIEGVDLIRCLDIYTGRVLWETRLPGVGSFFNNLAHQPGANASGTNYVSAADGIYVAYGRACLRLDPATGRMLDQFTLPLFPGMTAPSVWGYINLTGDYLVGGALPLYDPKLFKPMLVPSAGADKPPESSPLSKLAGLISKGDNDNMSSSKHLVVMQRQTGKVLWTATAQNGFRHNATILGGGRLYAIDRLSGAQIERMKRQGETPTTRPRLRVFDLKTGKELWSTEDDVFGTWLSYSAQHEVLVESGRNASDTMSDEARGMRAYRAPNGAVLWTRKDYLGPAMIHGDQILMTGKGCSLLSGAPKMRDDPFTGQPAEWRWTRNYGCNTPACSEFLMTFRSGAAGFLDLGNDGGTGNFGGFRSSCTNNLVVAGGVLTAPDYTRTCTCAYQNQTSLAMIHMPENEIWTFFGSAPAREPIRQLGVNLGAPGDRRAPDGTLWVEYPSVGGLSPVVPIRLTGARLEWFRRHSSQVQGELNWVGASGVKGLASLTIARGLEPEVAYACQALAQAFSPVPAGPAFFPSALGQIGLPLPAKPVKQKPPAERLYTLRLHFVEPDALKPGQRLFSVSVQGQEVLKDLDIVKEAGGPNRKLIKEIKGVKVAKELTITFTPSAAAAVKVPVLGGLELQAEGW